MNSIASIRKKLIKLLDSQIVLLDGAMGTMIQAYDLQEKDYRGNKFSNWSPKLQIPKISILQMISFNITALSVLLYINHIIQVTDHFST